MAEVALVTGGSRGIGRAVVVQLAKDGYCVLVHYGRDETAADETLALARAASAAAGHAGAEHAKLRAALEDEEEVCSLVEQAFAARGKVDVLVNNAGVYELLDVASASFEQWKATWERTININLRAPAHLSFLVGQRMALSGLGGRIVNVSSRGAFRGEPNAVAYGASKAGMNAMGQSLAQALAPHGVFVHTVAPGFVETDMARPTLEGPHGDEIRSQSPCNRVARPEEVAHTISFLCRRESAFLTGGIVDLNGASYLRS